MLDFWDKTIEMRMVRALDAACALLGDVDDSGARRAVLQRLLAVLFEAGAGTDDPMSELYAAQAVLAETPPPDGVNDKVALLWLERAQQRRAVALQEELGDHGSYTSEDIDNHPMWRVHQLTALPRRLRVLTSATRTSHAALARTTGLSAAQIGHWSAGRSRPGPAERDKLAAAFGIHPGWLAEDLDDHTPADWYAFGGGCPCTDTEDGTFAQASLDGHNTGIGAIVETGLWCAGDTGCGQPYLVDGDLYYPAPVLPDSSSLRFGAVIDGTQGNNCGPELDRPWPHALWNAPAGPQRRGPLHLPALLTRAPGSPW